MGEKSERVRAPMGCPIAVRQNEPQVHDGQTSRRTWAVLVIVACGSTALVLALLDKVASLDVLKQNDADGRE